MLLKCSDLWWISCSNRLPLEKQRGYKNVFDALVRITGEEGIGTLWRVGCGGGVGVSASAVWYVCVMCVCVGLWTNSG